MSDQWGNYTGRDGSQHKSEFERDLHNAVADSYKTSSDSGGNSYSSSSSSSSSSTSSGLSESRKQLIHEIVERQRYLKDQVWTLEPIGMKYLKDGDYDTAIDYMKAILVLQREHNLLEMGLNNLVKDEKFAYRCLDQADVPEPPKEKEMGKGYWGPYMHIGQSYFHKQDYKQAMEYIERSFGCFEDYIFLMDKKIKNANGSELLLLRGNTHEKLGDIKSAIADWKFAHDCAVCDEAVKNLTRHGIQYKRKPKNYRTKIFLPTIVSAVVFALIYGVLSGFDLFRLIVGVVVGIILGLLFFKEKRRPSIFVKIGITAGAIGLTLVNMVSMGFSAGLISMLFTTAVGALIGWLLGWLVGKFVPKAKNK